MNDNCFNNILNTNSNRKIATKEDIQIKQYCDNNFNKYKMLFQNNK